MLISQQKITPRITDLFAIFKKSSQLGKVQLRKYIPNQHLYWTGSGREALRQILIHLKEKKQSLRVGVPAYTCQVVLETVKRANCQPIIYDSSIISNIEDIKKIIHKIDTLVLCYNFGFLPEISKIKELCKQHNVILIEDCAQALGATHQNRLAGSFGDYAFYSFGISKNIGFCGGMISNNTKIKLKPISKFPLSKLLKVFAEVIISPVFFHPRIYPLSKKLLKKELNKTPASLNHKMPKLAKKIIINQFRRYSSILEQRKKNADFCIRHLKDKLDLVQPIPNSSPSHLYLAIRSENKNHFQKILLKLGIDFGEMKTFYGLDKPQSIKTQKSCLTFALYRNPKEIKKFTKIITQIHEKLKVAGRSK